MSAESYQKRAPSTSSDAVHRLVPNIVPPQAVSDRSIIDSVAGFINDVALTNAPQTDPKDHILWIKFENLADISDFSLGEDWDVEGGLPPPLLLCIGYGSGVQVWAIPANGEAIEVMSWKNGAVKVLRVLPTPFLSNNSELASDLLDQFIHKRPLMALCGDSPVTQSQASSQQFHSANFVSLKDGDVVKSIRFKSPIVDIVANRTSIAITFAERIAVFDARTLEDRLTVTTCYPCPGGLCPIALGDRWLAYAEKKMIPSKASAGGCFFEGVPSYTATVLNAAKSLGKGLRELGEQVAAGLTGSGANIAGQGGNAAANVINADGSQPGIVTILDIKHQIKDISPTTGTPVAVNGSDPIVAHFLAHAEAVTTMSFDPSGMLLLTADRRGNDFNVFRIQPHPSGSALAAVHHLYVLHRGDTSAKVQDISFSFDSRWVAVSSFRGTTHVFPITPYGGQPGYRTHSAPHVVNRLSRFHRSAGLTVDGRSSSPILMAEHAVHSTAYANPRLPPFPHPTVVMPLAQLRQPSTLGSATSSLTSSLSSAQGMQQGSKGLHSSSRQRLHSTNEETQSKPLRVAAVFGKARSWLMEPPGLAHETPSRLHRKAVDSLFVIAGHGALIQYDLEPKHVSNIAKDKICDETPIELDVEAKAQWVLGSRSNSQVELPPPLSPENWLIKDRVIDNNLNLDVSQIENATSEERDDRWLSQVEIVTHAGPHRRLWMGPQFMFKIYNTPSGSSLAHIDAESVEIGTMKAARSTPMNMPLQPSAVPRPLVPVLIESGSYSSHEQSPRLYDEFQYETSEIDLVAKPESQLREDLADAMKDCATISVSRDSDGSLSNLTTCKISTDLKSFNDRNIFSNNNLQTVVVSIVNPQGTVTTVTNNTIQLDESYSTDNYIHENFDETTFRPVITVVSEPDHQPYAGYEMDKATTSKVVDMPSDLIVPVIDEALLKQQKKKNSQIASKALEIVKAADATVVVEKVELKVNEDGEEKKLQVEEKVAAEVEKATMVEKQPEEATQVYQKRGKKGQKSKKYEDKRTADKSKKDSSEPERKVVKEPSVEKITTTAEAPKWVGVDSSSSSSSSIEKFVEVLEAPPRWAKEPSVEKIAEAPEAPKETSIDKVEVVVEVPKRAKESLAAKSASLFPKWVKEPSVERTASAYETPKWYKEPSVEKTTATAAYEVPKWITKPEVSAEIPKREAFEEALQKPAVMPTARRGFVKEASPENITADEPVALKSEELNELNEALSEMKLETESFELRKEIEEPLEAPKAAQAAKQEISSLKEKAARAAEKKYEPLGKKWKKGKKNDRIESAVTTTTTTTTTTKNDFEVVPSVKLTNQPEVISVDTTPDEEISKPEAIGDDEIEIIPHENVVVVGDDNLELMDAHLVDENLIQSQDFSKDGQQDFIKNEDFYDIDEDLPPLEPLESFEPFGTTSDKDPLSDSYYEKQTMKTKMSELLKTTNIVFAMCSSLKEIKEDADSTSIDTSQIQRSTSSSMTTNTTTSTFASANSNAGEGQDDKSLESEVEESSPTGAEMKTPADVVNVKRPNEDGEEMSGFETTSSETDDSSKKSSSNEAKFKRDDDEELRPLLQSSVTSLSPSASSSAILTPTTTTTTDANNTTTLPETNQKLLPSSQPASNTGGSTNNNNNSKRKNKKKRK